MVHPNLKDPTQQIDNIWRYVISYMYNYYLRPFQLKSIQQKLFKSFATTLLPTSKNIPSNMCVNTAQYE